MTWNLNDKQTRMDFLVKENDWLLEEIQKLRIWVNDLHSGMFINCVYCGHRYGPNTEIPASMADVLKKHIEQCPEHPMSKLKAECKQLCEANGIEHDRFISTLSDLQCADIKVEQLKEQFQAYQINRGKSEALLINDMEKKYKEKITSLVNGLKELKECAEHDKDCSSHEWACPCNCGYRETIIKTNELING